MARAGGGRLVGRALVALAAPFVLCACAHHDAARGFHAPLGTTRAEVDAPRAPLTQGADAPDNAAQVGLATWYGNELAGHKTSNGEIFDPKKMTAAHRKLPFNTWVEVRRVDTGRTVRVRINDRGPWGDPRKIIDLSRHAAEELGMIGEGTVHVEVRIVAGPG